MRFYIHSGNHDSQHGIGDTVLFLKNAIEDCGHTACISHTVVPGHVNIVVEHFVKEHHLRDLLEGHAKGARFVMLGTEPIVGGTFNGGIDASHWHYSNTDYWRVRFQSFKAALTITDAVWVLAESMLPGYRELFPKAGTPEYQSVQRQTSPTWSSSSSSARRPKPRCDGHRPTSTRSRTRRSRTSSRVSARSTRRRSRTPGYTSGSTARRRAVSVLSSKIFDAVTKDVEVTDQEVLGYYAANKSQYGTPESRDVRQILIARRRRTAGSTTLPARRKPTRSRGAQGRCRLREAREAVLGGSRKQGRRRKADDLARPDPPRVRQGRPSTSATHELSKPVKTSYGYYVIGPSPIRKATVEPSRRCGHRSATLLQQKRNEETQEWVEDQKKDYEGKVSYAAGYEPAPVPEAPTDRHPVGSRRWGWPRRSSTSRSLTRQLRRECPWDREQTERTIARTPSRRRTRSRMPRCEDDRAFKVSSETSCSRSTSSRCFSRSAVRETSSRSPARCTRSSSDAIRTFRRCGRAHPGRVKRALEGAQDRAGRPRGDLPRRSGGASRPPAGPQGATAGGGRRVRLAGLTGPLAKVREELEELEEAARTRGAGSRDGTGPEGAHEVGDYCSRSSTSRGGSTSIRACAARDDQTLHEPGGSRAELATPPATTGRPSTSTPRTPTTSARRNPSMTRSTWPAFAGDTMFPPCPPFFLRAWGTTRLPQATSPSRRGSRS